MFHYRKNRKIYDGYPKPDVCQFCDHTQHEPAVDTTKYAYVVPNRTFYDVWELKGVTDHLLLIPKRHVHSLSDLNAAEQADIMKAIARYESKGYNIYARSPDNVIKSVEHQHTHLIKTEKHPARGVIINRKPYFLIKF